MIGVILMPAAFLGFVLTLTEKTIFRWIYLLNLIFSVFMSVSVYTQLFALSGERFLIFRESLYRFYGLCFYWQL